jgi:beta-lactam-binding protein with PASTA domain
MIADKSRRAFRHLRSLAVNRYFWTGLAALLVLSAAAVLVLDKLVMPGYTRQSVSVTVPDLTNVSYADAASVLTGLELTFERLDQRFNPAVARDAVLDQNPAPGTPVKPGRRIYLSVNSGTTPIVTVPRVEGLALREARNRMTTAGLVVTSEVPDPIPSPYENTVTTQRPEAGERVDQGSAVTLWYSTGLGSEFVEVPDVVGLPTRLAARALLSLRLRSVVVDALQEDSIVVRQSRPPGTRVREGFEIRLFVTHVAGESAAADSLLLDTERP